MKPMEPAKIDPAALLAARKRRSVAIALALIAFVVTVFIVTLVRLQGHALNRPF
jgi:hypothetical protein